MPVVSKHRRYHLTPSLYISTSRLAFSCSWPMEFAGAVDCRLRVACVDKAFHNVDALVNVVCADGLAQYDYHSLPQVVH